MKHFVRLILVVALAAALLPARTVLAQSTPSECALIAAGLGASSQEGVLNGAQYCLIVPAATPWNHDVVLFAHGYVPPDPLTMSTAAPEIPWDQAIRGDLNLPGLLIKLGYAFGISSYRKSGLAVKEGVQDMVDLAGYVKGSGLPVKRIYLTGVSEGGLVTTLAIENYPTVFAGGLETCGPVGSFQAQVNYWSDFRVVFDALFPTILKNPTPPLYSPSTAIYTPPDVIAGWAIDPHPVALNVLQAIGSDPARTALLLKATNAPIDPADPVTTTQATVTGILDYNIQSTDEGRLELGDGSVTPADLPGTNKGSPYSNLGKAYKLPAGTLVDRYAPDPQALLEVAKSYETKGKLVRPLVLMHTTGDPIVPYWHTALYVTKALLKGSLAKVALIPIQRYGHCAFTPAEAVFGFYVMVLKATLQPFSMTQVKQALPGLKAQQEFMKIQQKAEQIP